MSLRRAHADDDSPIDGSVYVERELASDDDVETALARSAAAQKAWSESPCPSERPSAAA